MKMRKKVTALGTQNRTNGTIRHTDYTMLGDEDYRSAILARDAEFDGVVVYAVRSTRIYCRPSCASRRPNRRQVIFFPIPEVAEQAGFRPCLRCRPHLPSPADPQLEMVRQVCQHIKDHADRPLLLADIASKVSFSPHHMHRVFRRVMGITPRQYADACRLDRLKGNLRAGEDVTGAMYDSGYGSSSRLYEQSSAQLGMTPDTYRRGGKGAEMAYTIVDCYLGKLLVAGTAKGVCAVKLGDDVAALETGLRAEYPRSIINGPGGALTDWVSAILQHLSGIFPHLDLPLDIQATAFQRRVWQQLQAIPLGETRSYSQVAEELGNPKAARAVAAACAANPVALVVPCHRVVRRDGGLGGYRWGVDRKSALLDQELSGHDQQAE